MKPFLMMRKRNAIAGIFLNDNAGMPGLTKAGKVSLEPADPAAVAAVIYDHARNEVKVTFNGIVGGNVDGGVFFTVDAGSQEPFLTSRTSTNYVTYIAEANFLASHVVRWIYTPGTITVDGELLGAQDLLVSNQIASAPEYVSGRIYEQGGEQFAEITFNGPMLYSNYNGVTIKADGGAKAITAISGMGSTKVTYKTAGINNLHTVTWEYVSATGNLTNTGGDPLADVTPQVISNVLPFQTHWDLAGNDPTTYWDGDPPDNTPWDKD